MLIIYSMIIVLTFSVFGYIVLNNYKDKGIKREETRLFQTANIIADTYKRNMDDIIYARRMVKTYAYQANARILVVDKEKQVLIDSYNTYIGKTLDNREIRNSFNGESTFGTYTIQDEEVLQLSVPITINSNGKTETIGAVLISSSLNLVNDDVKDLRNDILRVSIFALLGALILTAISATTITSSLKELRKGIEKISTGELGYRISKGKKGEVGKFINTFNEMSRKLYNIEKNRKYFINSISHELKTPLTSIKALIDSLNIGTNTLDTYKEYLNDIKGETERMEALVQYLTDSIKLEDISLSIEIENVSKIIEETVKLITPYAVKNGVEIKLDITKNIMVRCDKNKIKEVLFNIIENSVKYKDSDKINNYVYVRLSKFKDEAILTVEDNGIGIDKADLANIFNRGFRVLENKRIEGHGIGLSIVKNILDKHGWSFSLKSELGKGSIFVVEIPII